MPQQGGGLFSALNPFNSIGQLANSFWNGGSGMSLAALIPAAFLMFGNFGWMGKIASLFLGSLAMKNISLLNSLCSSIISRNWPRMKVRRMNIL